MSDQSATTRKRAYRKRRRAELEEETRRRITEAAVTLHGTIGAARTTVSAIAKEADVQRATVYRHFPDEEAMFAACSTHYMSANPLPDLEAWAKIGDPNARLRMALDQLYAWYAGNDAMVANNLRDRPLVPALGPSMEQFGGWFAAAAELLVRGRPERGARRRRVQAALGHALGFGTWQSLTGAGLSQQDAVSMMGAFVAGAADA